MSISIKRLEKYIRFLLDTDQFFALATRPHPTGPQRRQVVFTDRSILLDVSAFYLNILPFTHTDEPTAYLFCHSEMSLTKPLTAEMIWKMWDEWTAEPKPDTTIALDLSNEMDIIDDVLAAHVLYLAKNMDNEAFYELATRSISVRPDASVRVSRRYISLLARRFSELHQYSFLFDAKQERVLVRAGDETVVGILMPLAKTVTRGLRPTAQGAV